MEAYRRDLLTGAQSCPCRQEHEQKVNPETVMPDMSVVNDQNTLNQSIGKNTFEEVDVEEEDGDVGLVEALQEEILSLQKELRVKDQELAALKSNQDCPQLAACEAAKSEVTKISEDRDLRMKALFSKNRRLLDRIYTCYSEKGSIS